VGSEPGRRPGCCPERGGRMPDADRRANTRRLGRGHPGPGGRAGIRRGPSGAARHGCRRATRVGRITALLLRADGSARTRRASTEGAVYRPGARGAPPRSAAQGATWTIPATTMGAGDRPAGAWRRPRPVRASVDADEGACLGGPRAPPAARPGGEWRRRADLPGRKLARRRFRSRRGRAERRRSERAHRD
jgi:hypothetical protein